MPSPNSPSERNMHPMLPTGGSNRHSVMRGACAILGTRGSLQGYDESDRGKRGQSNIRMTMATHLSDDNS